MGTRAWEGGRSKFSLLSHLSNFFTLVTSLGSQGLLQSPSYEKPVGCCLKTKGYLSPLVTLPSSLPTQQDSPSGGKSASFLSSDFQCNQKLSQDEQGHVPLTLSHSCPSKNGMGTTKRGPPVTAPHLHSAPRCRAGGAPSSWLSG